jgi:hypothetical protein
MQVCGQHKTTSEIEKAINSEDQQGNRQANLKRRHPLSMTAYMHHRAALMVFGNYSLLRTWNSLNLGR